MRLRVSAVLAPLLLVGCAALTPTPRPAPAVLRDAPPPAIMAAQAVPPAAPPTAPVPVSPAEAKPAPHTYADPLGSGVGKWKVFVGWFKPDQGAAERLAPVSGQQSRDLFSQLAILPTVKFPCRDNPANPDPGYYARVLLLNVSPDALKGVVRINGTTFRVTEQNLIPEEHLPRRPGTVNLKFWVRTCDGYGSIAVPRREVEAGWWSVAHSTMWWAPPLKYEELVTYPADYWLKTCSGRGDDGDLCGRHEVDAHGELHRKMMLDTVTYFTFRVRVPAAAK